MNQPAKASAPASTGNLGPAFDCLALALSPRCTVYAERADDWSIAHVGDHLPEHREEDGVLVAAQKAVGDRPLALRVETQIPRARGLGSSGAAFVAGAAAALRAVGEDASLNRVYRIAAALEGHADQAAASVFGGLILIPAEGMPIRLPLHPTLRPVVAVPDVRLPTREARAVLPESYSLDVVVRSLGRVSALTAGLISGDPELLAASHGDEIHESWRDEISPQVAELMTIARRAGALHAARSGAGPSVLAITTQDKADVVAEAFADWGADVIHHPAETTGLV